MRGFGSASRCTYLQGVILSGCSSWRGPPQEIWKVRPGIVRRRAGVELRVVEGTLPHFVPALARRRQLLAPRFPAGARPAREQFEIRAAEQSLHAAIGFVRLLRMHTDRRLDDGVHAFIEAQRFAALSEQAGFGILPGGIAVAPVEAFARIQLDPIEGEARESKPQASMTWCHIGMFGQAHHRNNAQSSAASEAIGNALIASSGMVS